MRLQNKRLMLLIKHIDLLEKTIAGWKASGLSIGFVPTMGALHQGHLSLIEQALTENDKVVCSIFVNPTQFNNPNDLENYPIQLEVDVEKLSQYGCHLAFSPSKADMYPGGESSTHFELDNLDKPMEGSHRPGHFDGVCTIVSKFFELVQPNNAYFGQKDFQQLAVIRQLNKSQNFGINIVGCPIIRENDGLAMSSRNALLSKEERAIAPNIYRIISEAKRQYSATSISELKSFVEEEIKAIADFRLDYVEIAHADTLQTLKNEEKDSPAILCIAVFLGSVRLIDNILLN